MNQVYLLLMFKYYCMTAAIVVKTDSAKEATKNDLIPADDKLSRMYLPPTGDVYEEQEEEQEPECNTGYVAGAPHVCLLPPAQKHNFRAVPGVENPLLAALILSTSLGLHPNKVYGFNHPEHLPLNPYIDLLLSHYGKYTPIHGTSRGLYGYAAANNYHNNKPFGAYKIYEENGM